jgi:hypothetical protein
MPPIGVGFTDPLSGTLKLTPWPQDFLRDGAEHALGELEMQLLVCDRPFNLVAHRLLIGCAATAW